MNINRFLTDAVESGVDVAKTGITKAKDFGNDMLLSGSTKDPARVENVKANNPSNLTGHQNYPSGITTDPLGFVNYMPYPHGKPQAGSNMGQGFSELGVDGPLQINLHMPSEMQDELDAKWEAEEDLLSQASKIGIKQALTGATREIAGAVGEGLSFGKLDSDGIKKALDRKLGHAVRPFEEQFFGGVEYRTFSFTHKLIAFDRDETVTINKIIKSFRYHASPGLTAGDSRYKYPSTWRIRFYNPDPNNASNVKESVWLPTLRRCVLTKVGVNHFNSDTPTYHENLAPVDIELSLEFQETEYVTKNSILYETQPDWK